MQSTEAKVSMWDGSNTACLVYITFLFKDFFMCLFLLSWTFDFSYGAHLFLLFLFEPFRGFCFFVCLFFYFILTFIFYPFIFLIPLSFCLFLFCMYLGALWWFRYCLFLLFFRGIVIENCQKNVLFITWCMY